MIIRQSEALLPELIILITLIMARLRLSRRIIIKRRRVRLSALAVVITLLLMDLRLVAEEEVEVPMPTIHHERTCHRVSIISTNTIIVVLPRR